MDTTCTERNGEDNMKPKFKLGDRVRYTGKSRRSHPIPGEEYNIISNGMYRPVAGDFEPGDYEYSLAPALGNIDPNRYCCIEEKYLELVNPSKIIFG